MAMGSAREMMAFVLIARKGAVSKSGLRSSVRSATRPAGRPLVSLELEIGNFYAT